MSTRFDGWFNIATNLGSPTHDKTTRASFSTIVQVSDSELRTMFNFDPVSRRICIKPGREAMREGFRVSLPDMPGEQAALMKWAKKIKLNKVVARAHALSEAFGGSAIWIGTNDSARRSKPPNSYSEIVFLKVFDRRYLTPAQWDEDPRSPTFGLPLTYYLTPPSKTGEFVELHRDRLAIFDGRDVTEDERQDRNSWGMSILEVVYETLRRNGVAWQTAHYAFSDRGFSTLKIANLLDMLEAEGGKEAVEKRAAAVEAVRSVARAIVIGDNEEWTLGDLDFGNMPEMLSEFMHDLAAAVDMPVTVLFGRSPGGENATGESDLTLWYDHVRDLQTTTIEPVVEQIIEAAMKATGGPTKGKVPDDWSLSFNPLRQLGPLEKAELRLKTAKADSLDIAAEVLLPEEVARARYSAGGYSTETVVDTDVRSDILEEELKQAAEAAKLTPQERAAQFGFLGAGGAASAKPEEPVSGSENSSLPRPGASATEESDDQRDV